MRTIIIIAMLWVAFSGHAQTNQIVSTNDLATIQGTVYKDVHIEKVLPAGLLVSFKMKGGGIGMANVRFENLSKTLQEKYGYNQQAASAYDASLKKAVADMTLNMIATDQNAKQSIAKREADDEAAARQAKIDSDNERKIAAEEKKATAAMIQASNPIIVNQATLMQQGIVY